MKLITRDTDYAVRALVCMAEAGERVVSVSELIKCMGVPRSFLRKTLQLLTKKNVTVSYKGKGGGFALAGAPGKIYLYELMEIFQGEFKMNEHMLKGKPCPNIPSCRLKERTDRIESMVEKELKKINIRSLMKK